MTLLAEPLRERQGATLPQTAWYVESLLTFSDTLALARHSLE